VYGYPEAVRRAETVHARRVARQRYQVPGVDDPRVGAILAVLVPGRRPAPFVVDPVGHVGFADRDRVGNGERHPAGVQVPEEFPRGTGTVGADQDLLPKQRAAGVEKVPGSWAVAASKTRMWSSALFAPALPGRSRAARISPMPSPVP
jgi:hypothetical protein